MGLTLSKSARMVRKKIFNLDYQMMNVYDRIRLKMLKSWFKNYL